MYHETDAVVASKTKFALDGGLSVILCCGETLEEREAGKTIDVVSKQLKAVVDVVKDWSKVVIAYEPIWYVFDDQSCIGLRDVILIMFLQGHWYRQSRNH